MGNLLTFEKLSCIPVASSEFLLRNIVFQLIFLDSLGIKTYLSQIMIALFQPLIPVFWLMLARTSRTQLMAIPFLILY